jgi:hypothetical protein
MSVKRYDPITQYIGTGEYVGDMELAVDGEYVRHEDYAALEREADLMYQKLHVLIQERDKRKHARLLFI